MSVSIACRTPRRSALKCSHYLDSCGPVAGANGVQICGLGRFEASADGLQRCTRLIGDAGRECGPNGFESGPPFGERVGCRCDVGQTRVRLEQGQSESRLECGAVCGRVHELTGGVDGQTGGVGRRRSIVGGIRGQIRGCGEHRPGRFAHGEEHRCVLVGIGETIQVETVHEWGDSSMAVASASASVRTSPSAAAAELAGS